MKIDNHENTPATHTPGPWKADKGHEDEPERWTVVADNGTQPYIIALLIDDAQPGDTTETEGATARLMAAAPELLAACRKKFTAQMLRDTALAHELYTARDSAMQAAEEAEFEADEFMRAAIAKAEGK